MSRQPHDIGPAPERSGADYYLELVAHYIEAAQACLAVARAQRGTWCASLNIASALEYQRLIDEALLAASAVVSPGQ